jgi:hypothetical protein
MTPEELTEILRREPAPLIPNAETIAALEAAERGEMKTFATIEALFADLNSDDAVLACD